MRRYCCAPGCDKNAEFVITGNLEAAYENETEMCAGHLVLGLTTPDTFPIENSQWTVVPIPAEQPTLEERVSHACDLLTDYGMSIRLDWSDIDGRTVLMDLGKIADYLRGYRETLSRSDLGLPDTINVEE